jgi:sialate O-acetylesterase
MRTLRSAVLPLLAGLLVLHASVAFADVKPHALITDGMVLQQGPKANIWGTADKGEEIVTVSFLGRDYKTAVGPDGKWVVQLVDLKPGGPHEMTIAGTNKVTIKNVLIGEVWIASGQSNMEMHLQSCADAEKAINASANPKIHLFTVPHTIASTPQLDVNGKWSECNPDTVKNFSAVAYYFGRDVQKALDVPVGIIHTSWGGTPAESWTSRGTLEANAALKYYVAKADKEFTDDPEAIAKYKEDLAKYEEAAKKAKEEGKPAPRAPQAPGKNSHTPTGLYNGMIAPLLPYAIRGAIWYQGESNAGKADEYRTLFPAMIKDWREQWKQGDFPFLFVQLAPFMKIEKEPTDPAWAHLREAQLVTMLTVPKTGMAVITDVGDEKDIHPKQKEPVGARLALAAQALAYGQKIEYSGPIFDKLKVDGNKAIISFTHVGGGLVARGDKLEGFTIAGEDKQLFNADATIDGDKVIVVCDKVARPVAVRFGWANYPVVNLWNKDGLPATPFRTDDFPVMPPPAKK